MIEPTPSELALIVSVIHKRGKYLESHGHPIYPNTTEEERLAVQTFIGQQPIDDEEGASDASPMPVVARHASVRGPGPS